VIFSPPIFSPPLFPAGLRIGPPPECPIFSPNGLRIGPTQKHARFLVHFLPRPCSPRWQRPARRRIDQARPRRVRKHCLVQLFRQITFFVAVASMWMRSSTRFLYARTPSPLAYVWIFSSICVHLSLFVRRIIFPGRQHSEWHGSHAPASSKETARPLTDGQGRSSLAQGQGQANTPGRRSGG